MLNENKTATHREHITSPSQDLGPNFINQILKVRDRFPPRIDWTIKVDKKEMFLGKTSDALNSIATRNVIVFRGIKRTLTNIEKLTKSSFVILKERYKIIEITRRTFSRNNIVRIRGMRNGEVVPRVSIRV